MSEETTFQGALSFAAELIRIPSPPGGEEALARRVVEEMELLGYDRIRIDAAGSVVGVVEGRGEAPPVMLSCHLDAVDQGDPEGWEHPPFSGAVADGFLHGRGAMDIKGPLAIQTYAAAALRRPPPGDVIVAHTVLEERGGWGMARLLGSGEVEPAALIVGEATHGDVAIGHRGRAEVEVVARGLAGHASAPDRARNPLRLLPAIVEAVSRVAGDQPVDDVLGAATLAPTAVEVRPTSRNVIPDRVVVALDWRILPGMEEEALVASLRDALAEALRDPPEGLSLEAGLAGEEQRTWTGLVEERSLFTPGFLLDPGHPVVRAAADVLAGEGRGRPEVRPWTFATDGGHACGVHGIPTIGYAPGEERFAHTNRERLEIGEAEEAFRCYPDLILAVQRAAG